MATGNKAFTSQESGNPYFKGVVGTSSSIPSRAIMNNGSSASVNITFADGVVAAVYMEQGSIKFQQLLLVLAFYIYIKEGK